MISFIGIPLEKLDKSKYIRQLREVVTWKNGFKARSTITACTGFGKSIMAIIAIKKMLKKNEHRRTLIVVHSTPLKQQWEKHVINFKLFNTQIITIQSLSKYSNLQFDLLIIDEIHLFGSEEFGKIFQKVKYYWILGLTGTFERLDGKHVYISKYCPVSGGVDLREAVAKGWVSDFIEVNVPIYMTKTESEKLSNINKQISFFMSKFGSFDTLMKCMKEGHARILARKLYPNNVDEMTSIIIGWSVRGQRYVKMRQAFLYNLQHKVDFVEQACKFDLKTIVFSQSIKFVEDVNTRLSECFTYHSQVQGIIEEVDVKVERKTLNGAKQFAEKVKGKVVKNKDKFIVLYKKPLKVGKEEVLRKNLLLFRNSDFGKLVTAKALDTGYDDDSIELGIDCARTSSPTQHKQRVG